MLKAPVMDLAQSTVITALARMQLEHLIKCNYLIVSQASVQILLHCPRNCSPNSRDGPEEVRFLHFKTPYPGDQTNLISS